MRRPLGCVVAAAVLAGAGACAAGTEDSGWFCHPLVEVLGNPPRTWVRAVSAKQVEPGTYPDADAVLASSSAQGAEWSVLGLDAPALVRVATSTPEMSDPAQPDPSPLEGIPGVDGRTPSWVLAEGASAEQLVEVHPADGWLLEVATDGFLTNVLAVDGDEVRFVPGPCATAHTQSLANSASAVDMTPAELAMALIQGDEGLPRLPGSTVPD